MKSNLNSKAVFLDRDGTIIKDIPYLNDPNKISIFPEGFEAVKKLNQSGFKVIIATNQSGVARRLIEESMVKRINNLVIEQFKDKGAIIDDAFYCPHATDTGCQCRKPNPGMLNQAAKKHNIDLKKSWMVGDRMIDVLCGENAGSRSIILKNEHTPPEEPQNGTPKIVKANILEAALYIIANQ